MPRAVERGVHGVPFVAYRARNFGGARNFENATRKTFRKMGIINLMPVAYHYDLISYSQRRRAIGTHEFSEICFINDLNN